MVSKQSTATADASAAGIEHASEEPTVVEHLSMEGRAVLGRAARALVPRSAHGDWQPAADRQDPVTLLEEQAADRVRELVPMRNSRMLVSPFTSYPYRGASYLMASDLAATPRTGLNVQLCGDAHLLNFGTFAAPDRKLVFSVNDFDETLPGPFEWDVKRPVAMLAVALLVCEWESGTSRNTWRHPSERNRRYLGALIDWGYSRLG